ncbi:AAA family ATPase [Phycisphaeraceae bacterium D3-23]
MTKILSCVNLKGGVGKTAISVNFAAFCGEQGLNTLLVDLDPQTNATFSCISIEDWESHATDHGTAADLLGARAHTSADGSSRDAAEVLVEEVFSNVDLIPSHLDLFTVDLDLAGSYARETKLKRALSPILEDYDIIVCDCPPNLTIPTQNALAMSTHFVVPISPDFLSGIGVALLINRVAEMGAALGQEPEHVGIVMSRVGRPAKHRSDTAAALRTQFGELVLRQEIKERASVAASAEAHTPIYDMGNRDAAGEFRAVGRELLRRMGVK